MYRVVIVDDEGMPRRILAREIESKAPDFALAGVFKTGDQAWAFLEKEEADILITDIKMPGMSGLELARRVAARWPETVISIITGYSEFEYARQAIGLGVCSFLLKPINLAEFADALSHMGRQRQERLQRRSMQFFVQQDAVDEFVLDLQEGSLSPAERSRRFRACAFPFSEAECGAELATVRLEAGSREPSDAEKACRALKNVLRMNFPDCFFTDVQCEKGKTAFLALYDAGSPWQAEKGAQAILNSLGRRAILRSEWRVRGLEALGRRLASPAQRAQAQGESDRNRMIEKALKYIDEHYAQDITRFDVANHLYLNPGYFGRLFKQMTGETFGDYLVKLRMQKAIELLFSSRSVAQISEMVGYANPSSFTRVFRLYTSYTPTEYRRLVLRREDE